VFDVTNIGQQLKEAREAKGITLEEIQDMTKIQRRYLEAIEIGNHSSLPGGFYVRAFIKQYADAVGVSIDGQLNPSQEVFKEPAQEEVGNIDSRRNSSKLKKEKKKKKKIAMTVTPSSSFTDFIPRILLGIAVIGILVAIWYAFQLKANGNASEKGPKQPNQVAIDTESNESANSPLNDKKKTEDTDKNIETPSNSNTEDVKNPTDTEQDISVKETKNNRSTLLLTNSDSFVVTLSAKTEKESYVRVRNNEGNVFFEGLIKPGSSVNLDLTAENMVEMNIGYTPGLEVMINEEIMDYPIDANVKPHQIINIEHKTTSEGASS
jgi:cytoskeletal protein RodZ